MKNKTIYFLLIFWFAALTGLTNSQTILLDDFQYPPMTSLAGVNGWQQNYAPNPNNPIPVVNSTLIYTGYPGSFLGNCILIKNNVENSSTLTKMFSETVIDTGSLYLACMLRVDTLTPAATDDFLIAFDKADSPTNIKAFMLLQRNSATTFKMGIRKHNADNYSNTLFNVKTTYLVVMKYKFVPGSTTNDIASLFVLTSGIPQSEPVPLISSTLGTDASDLGEVLLNNHAFFMHEGLKGSLVKIDGIRIAKTWMNTVLTGVNQTSTEVPAEYTLEQNYPNPFNPATKINFSMVKSGNAKLTVFDITGREVAVLVNENLSIGSYTVDFDASKLTSGVYFYRLQTGDFVQTKKMTLVK